MEMEPILPKSSQAIKRDGINLTEVYSCHWSLKDKTHLTYSPGCVTVRSEKLFLQLFSGEEIVFILELDLRTRENYIGGEALSSRLVWKLVSAHPKGVKEITVTGCGPKSWKSNGFDTYSRSRKLKEMYLDFNCKAFEQIEILDIDVFFKLKIVFEEEIRHPQIGPITPLAFHFEWQRIEEFSDVKLVSVGKIHPCHKFVLASHSQVFRTMLKAQEDCGDVTTGTVVETKGYDNETVKNALDYMYQKLDCSKLGEVDAFNLFRFAKEYEMEHLKMVCGTSLSQFVTDSNCAKMLQIALKNEIPNLGEKAKFLIKLNPRSVMISQDFAELMAEYPRIFYEGD